jgi:2-aminobenzoate-CoA ligase
MGLTRSAHVDTFCRDHLPPVETWPTLTFDLPELHYPERLNCAVELLDATAQRLGGDRPAVSSPTETWTYEDLRVRSNQVAQVLVHDHGVTILSTAPTAYKAMIAGGAAELLSGLRRGISAGETLPKATWEAFYDATGVKLIDGIGATEMLHVFISASDDAIRPGATGIPVPGYQARVVGPDGQTVPDGTPGRLAVIGPTGCRYLNGAHQEVYVQGGWNVTGDTYIRDSDGYFFYQARTDDMIVSSGYNIGAPEVEAALGQHPDVAECAVVARPDDDRGSVGHAAVVLRDGVLGDADKVRELQDFVKAQIAPYKYPRSVEFVTDLPRSATGKLQRSVIRRQVEAR